MDVGLSADVVLCTPRETYKVTKVESSNTTLLAAAGGRCEKAIVGSAVDFHWEAARVAPRVDFASSLPAYAGPGVAPTLRQLRKTCRARGHETLM